MRCGILRVIESIQARKSLKKIMCLKWFLKNFLWFVARVLMLALAFGTMLKISLRRLKIILKRTHEKKPWAAAQYVGKVIVHPGFSRRRRTWKILFISINGVFRKSEWEGTKAKRSLGIKYTGNEFHLMNSTRQFFCIIYCRGYPKKI